MKIIPMFLGTFLLSIISSGAAMAGKEISQSTLDDFISKAKTIEEVIEFIEENDFPEVRSFSIDSYGNYLFEGQVAFGQIFDIEDRDLEKLITAIVDKFPKLEQLSLNRCNLRNRHLGLLAGRLPELQALSIKGNSEITDSAITSIRSFPKLKKVIFIDTGIFNTEFKKEHQEWNEIQIIDGKVRYPSALKDTKKAKSSTKATGKTEGKNLKK